MFRKIDDFLIDRVFQPRVDEYQRKTERNNFGLAAIVFTILSILGFAYLVVVYKQTSEIRFFIALAPIASTGLAFQAQLFERMFDGIREHGMTVTFRQSPLSLGLRVLVTIFVFTIPIDVQEIIDGDLRTIVFDLSNILFWIGLYIVACSPRSSPEEEEKVSNLDPASI